MCGIIGIIKEGISNVVLDNMLSVQKHRGPDATGKFHSQNNQAHLGHNRLSILDLSEAGTQPMISTSGRYVIVLNGEIYNYREIKVELGTKYQYQSETDTEVVLNAFVEWGKDCLNKLIGMFAFAIWDNETSKLFIARDRLGVKPFHYHLNKDGLYFSSEIKALFAAGIEKQPNFDTWATYLSTSAYDVNNQTFWKDILKLPAGHYGYYSINEGLSLHRWYYLPDVTGVDFDPRPMALVQEEYLELLKDSINLRFRADVPLGFNLSGGLDSSALLGMVDLVQGKDSNITSYSFYTNDDRYDELPWVEDMLKTTKHPLKPCLLTADDVMNLAEKVQYHQDEPYGGVPTIAYSQVFNTARKDGNIVLLDGQGMDEQWAGYDYYRKAGTTISSPTLQGSINLLNPNDALSEEVKKYGLKWAVDSPYPDLLRNLQYRDAFYTKIPRALRFNDRVSMSYSTELREPFLDHRLFELAFQQPREFKIQNETGKWFMRDLLKNYLPSTIVEAPKRALQTPQREWLRNELKDWTYSHIDNMFNVPLSLLFNKDQVYKLVEDYMNEKTDNSFFIWQWISISLLNF